MRWRGCMAEEICVKDLAEPLLAGRTVLLYGPMGSGKSALLEALARRMKKQRRPCGFCRQLPGPCPISPKHCWRPTRRCGARGAPSVSCAAIWSMPSRRGRVCCCSIIWAMWAPNSKGICAPCGGPDWGCSLRPMPRSNRDHDQLRAMHLAFLEVEVPPTAEPLPASHPGREPWRPAPLPFALTDTDRSALIRMARGRPGWVIWAGRMLGEIHIGARRTCIVGIAARRDHDADYEWLFGRQPGNKEQMNDPAFAVQHRPGAGGDGICTAGQRGSAAPQGAGAVQAGAEHFPALPRPAQAVSQG